jgi:hypothetical protein
MAYTETARKRARTAAGIFPAVSAGTITFTAPGINTVTTNTDTFNVPGSKVGDLVFVSPKAIAAGLYVEGAEITAPGTLTVKLRNPTAGTIAGAATQLSYIVLRG